MYRTCIIIPTYNEAENLPELSERLEHALPREYLEIIVVDDNSPDRTAELARKLSKKYGNIKLLVRLTKMGLGSAYKDAFKISSGSCIVEMDADLSHDPKELPKLIEALNYADLVVGSRRVKYGRIIGWKWDRKLISWAANLFSKVVLGLDVKDATSGFRAYKREAFAEIVSRSYYGGFEFQVEALYIAKRLGFRVAEVPIVFIDRRKGCSKLKIRDIFGFCSALFKMRFERTQKL